MSFIFGQELEPKSGKDKLFGWHVLGLPSSANMDGFVVYYSERNMICSKYCFKDGLIHLKKHMGYLYTDASKVKWLINFLPKTRHANPPESDQVRC